MLQKFILRGSRMLLGGRLVFLFAMSIVFALGIITTTAESGPTLSGTTHQSSYIELNTPIPMVYLRYKVDFGKDFAAFQLPLSLKVAMTNPAGRADFNDLDNIDEASDEIESEEPTYWPPDPIHTPGVVLSLQLDFQAISTKNHFTTKYSQTMGSSIPIHHILPLFNTTSGSETPQLKLARGVFELSRNDTYFVQHAFHQLPYFIIISFPLSNQTFTGDDMKLLLESFQVDITFELKLSTSSFISKTIPTTISPARAELFPDHTQAPFTITNSSTFSPGFLAVRTNHGGEAQPGTLQIEKIVQKWGYATNFGILWDIFLQTPQSEGSYQQKQPDRESQELGLLPFPCRTTTHSTTTHSGETAPPAKTTTMSVTLLNSDQFDITLTSPLSTPPDQLSQSSLSPPVTIMCQDPNDLPLTLPRREIATFIDWRYDLRGRFGYDVDQLREILRLKGMGKKLGGSSRVFNDINYYHDQWYYYNIGQFPSYHSIAIYSSGGEMQQLPQHQGQPFQSSPQIQPLQIPQIQQATELVLQSYTVSTSMVGVHPQDIIETYRVFTTGTIIMMIFSASIMVLILLTGLTIGSIDLVRIINEKLSGQGGLEGENEPFTKSDNNNEGNNDNNDGSDGLCDVDIDGLASPELKTSSNIRANGKNDASFTLSARDPQTKFPQQQQEMTSLKIYQ